MMTLCYSDCSRWVQKFMIKIQKQFREIWFPARAVHQEESRLSEVSESATDL